MAKKSSLFDDLFYIASRLPWWVSLGIAIGSGVYLHSVASAPITTSTDIHHLQSMVLSNALRVGAMFGQYLLPLIFSLGAIASLWNTHKRRKRLDTAAASTNPLLSISWREFELLVGETLRRRGFKVQESGGQGPDGGVDLVARKDGETYLVQCKQWRSVKVGVPVVRELYGAMAAEGAVGGFVVTSGVFTEQAREFASGRNLQLVDGAELKRWIAETKKPEPRPMPERVEPVMVEPGEAVPKVKEAAARQSVPEAPVTPTAPACPFCRKTMVIKVARTGANAGGNFWGCVDFPRCRGIRPIFAPMKPKGH